MTSKGAATTLTIESLELRNMLSTMAEAEDAGNAVNVEEAQAEPSFLVLAESDRVTGQLKDDISQAGGRLQKTIPKIGVAIASSTDPKFVDRLMAKSGVESVIPNLPMFGVDPSVSAFDSTTSSEFTPDDNPLFSLQWSLDAINAPDAWAQGARGTGTRVAVLDGGIDTDHPDLAGNLNLSLSTSFVDDEPLEFNPDIGGFFSHGTHVAGIIAAADNGLGTIGVAPEAELVHIKVLSDDGTGTLDSILAGIVHATEIGADVINLSLGSTVSKNGYAILDPSDPDDDVFLGTKAVRDIIRATERATTFAYKNGATVVAAAGNSGINRDRNGNWVVSPADGRNVLAVSATGPIGWALDQTIDLDVPTSYTNYGRTAIDFAAPGGDRDLSIGGVCSVRGSILLPCWAFDFVLSTNAEADWTLASGTSMAAPHVAGVAALVISQHGGDLAPDRVEAILRGSADNLGTNGKHPYLGHGRIDAHAAVLVDSPVNGQGKPRPSNSIGAGTSGDAQAGVAEVTETDVEYTANNVHDTTILDTDSMGDANRDGRFDQLDIVAVLQAAKYMSQESADWAEGDWNGDGIFSQLDIVLALQAGGYLQHSS